PRSPQWLALFEGKKVQKSYPTRFLDLFSRPYINFALGISTTLLFDKERKSIMAKNKIVVLSDVHIGTNVPTNWYQKSFHEPY
ncbi:MAG: hypothetical protein LW716_00330, partial [Microcystis sp. 53602_E8]|nr:hypothetical protein [Microcystis sp. 53602_E8]